MSLDQGAQCIQTNGVTFFGERRFSLTLSILFLQGLTVLTKVDVPESSDVIHLGTNSANGLAFRSFSESLATIEIL